MLSEPFLELLAAVWKSIPHYVGQCPDLGRAVETPPGEAPNLVKADPARAHEPIGALEEAADTVDRWSRPIDHNPSVDVLLPGNAPYGLEFEQIDDLQRSLQSYGHRPSAFFALIRLSGSHTRSPNNRG